MSLQPIDLQTLFVRLSQIGKEQAARKESQVLQQEARGNELARQAKLNDESVNQTNELKDESGKVREKKEGSTGSPGHEHSETEEQRREGRGEEKKKRNVFEDPALGKNIDISG